MTNKPSRRERLARFRDLMRNAADLSEPVNYFLDHLAGDREFIRESQPGDPGLDEILVTVAARLCGPGTPLRASLFLQCGELWHGSCVFGRRIATILYDRGSDVGIVALPLGDRTELVRFSVLMGFPVSGEHGTDTEGLN